MEIRNYGIVRGGANEHGRLFIHVMPSDKDMTKEETRAIFEPWDEEFGMEGAGCYQINTRRQFALVPAIVRKALRLGWDVYTSMWDVGLKGEVTLSEEPAAFWQTIALAQMFYEK